MKMAGKKERGERMSRDRPMPEAERRRTSTAITKAYEEAKGMGRWRKKPIEVSAFQVKHACEVQTLEGTMRAQPGDWIITGVEGEKYPCADRIFRKTYEPADTADIEFARLCAVADAAWALREVQMWEAAEPSPNIFDVAAITDAYQRLDAALRAWRENGGGHE